MAGSWSGRACFSRLDGPKDPGGSARGLRDLLVGVELCGLPPGDLCRPPAQLIAGWDLSEWAPGGALPARASRPDWFSQLLEAAASKRDRQEPDKDLREPIVIMVDGLDEAEADGTVRWGLPLGLPESLPDGVYVVATSRFGIDRALHAVRKPADWRQIEVRGHRQSQ